MGSAKFPWAVVGRVRLEAPDQIDNEGATHWQPMGNLESVGVIARHVGTVSSNDIRQSEDLIDDE